MRTRNLLAFAAATLVLAACSNDEEAVVNSNFPEDGVIRVATNVDSPATRAGMTTGALTSFYLDITNGENATSYSYFVEMKKETDVWNAYDKETLTTMLWQNNSTPIKVTAAYLNGHAFTEDKLTGTTPTALAVAADQSAAEGAGIAANDLLGMPTTTINPSKADDPNLVDGKLKVTLKHTLAKLKLIVKLGTEFNATTAGTGTNPISDVAINGTKLNYTYSGPDMKIALPETTDNNAAAVTPYTVSYKAGESTTKNAVAIYECILVPQTVEADNFSVSMKINEVDYVWTSAATVEMGSGIEYALVLTAGKEILTVSKLAAYAWGNGTGSNIATE